MGNSLETVFNFNCKFVVSMVIDFLKGLFKKISSREIVYYLFPVLFIAIIYYAYIPFTQTYIGEWHDIFANSLYYNIIYQDYFATWNNLGSGGFPLVASPHSDKYYVFSVPFYLIFKSLSVVNFILLLHLVIAYFAFFKFGSLVTKNNTALMIFSLFFSFSGMLFGRVFAGHHLLLYGLVWIPLLYYFFFKITYFEESAILNVLGFSIVSFLIYCTGNIYHFVFAYFVMAIFFLYYAITGKISRKMLSYIALALFLTFLLISVKSLPDLNISGSITRNDVINPLTGGGSLETDLASFVSGTRIDTVWSQPESGIMVGIIPILFMIIALVYGKRDFGIPAFFTIILSTLWAAGDKTLITFMHFLPIVNSLRNPGRIFGAVLPIVLFLALSGAVILYRMNKKGEDSSLSPSQKKMIIYGISILVLVKFLEFPFQEMVTPITLIPAVLVAGFLILLYIDRGTPGNILKFLSISLVVNFFLITYIYELPGKDLIIPITLVILLFAGLYLYLLKFPSGSGKMHFMCIILLGGIVVMTMGNLGSGYITVFSPELEKSPAPEIIEIIKTHPTENAQLWAYEPGKSIQHMDFTYWDTVNGIDAMHIYAPYYLKGLPQQWNRIGNITYSLADYIVDTEYLETGNANLPEYTFKVKNISVLIPDHILPTVFYIRNNQIQSLKIEKYSPSEVIASGDLKSGDVIIFKSVFYPGWEINGYPADNINNLVGIRLGSDTNRVRISFEPLDFKIGALLSGLGVLFAIFLFVKRKSCEDYINQLSESKLSDRMDRKYRK
jgi:hypothetical protein